MKKTFKIIFATMLLFAMCLSTIVAQAQLVVRINEDTQYPYTPKMEKIFKDAVVLCIDSPKMLVDNTELLLDYFDPKIAPFIRDDITMIPVRFVAEAFQAIVDWTSDSATVTIMKNGKKAEFCVGTDSIKINNTTVQLNNEIEIEKGRVFLPLRIIAEEILDKHVWYEKGLIVISEKENLLYEKNTFIVDDMITILRSVEHKKGLLRIFEDGKNTFINTDGEIVLEIDRMVYDFHDGLACIEGEKGKFGFIDVNGDIVIEEKFDTWGFFSEGRAFVRYQGDDYCIDKEGNIVFELPKDFRVYKNYYNGRVIIHSSNEALAETKYGFMDRYGKVVIKPQFKYTFNYSEGLAAVNISVDRWGYIDIYGNMAVEPMYSWAKFFSSGLASVNKSYDRAKPHWCYINRNGEVMNDKGGVSNYINGLSLVIDGFQDYYGNIVIDGSDFLATDEFSEGLAPVSTNPGWAYIDVNGEVVLRPEKPGMEKMDNIFELGKFDKGFAPMMTYKNFYYINKSGKIVWQRPLTDAEKKEICVGTGGLIYPEYKEKIL